MDRDWLEGWGEGQLREESEKESLWANPKREGARPGAALQREGQLCRGPGDSEGGLSQG